MKYVSLLTCLFYFFSAFSQTHPCPDALSRYWEFKDRLHKHFVRLDHWGDGIGTWDNDRLQYSKAGYSLPASSLRVQKTGCNYWQYSYYNCYASPEITSNCQVSNVLRWGDTTIDLGYYLAMLATEYELLSRNGQFEQRDKTLHEIWLALQAYRRLDMTANRIYHKWKEKYDSGCRILQSSGMCGHSAEDVDFSGYSGFFVRDDVPNSIHHFFNANANGDKAWEVGGIRADFSCNENDLAGNFLPDKNTLSGDYTPSQDQMIGMLFGLAFVKRFIPPSEKVFGQNVLEVAQKIAAGFLNHIHPADETIEHYRSIRYPGCLQDTPTERGSNASNFFYAINLAIAYINPNVAVCIDGVDAQKWKAFGLRACDCGLPYYENCGFNCRMLLELMAVTDEGNFNKIQDKAYDIEKEIHIAARYLLHPGRYDIFDIKSIIRHKLNEILCEKPPICGGPCYRGGEENEPFYECPNTPGWCTINRCKNGNWDLIKNCNYSYNEDIRGNGIDFMLSHNIYLLTYFPEAPFFNPDSPENETCFHLPNIFLGEKSVCPAGQTVLQIPDELADFEEIQWGVSQNLALTFTDVSKKSAEVSAKNETDTLGWVRVKIVRNGCDRTYSWSKIRIGPPPVPVLADRSTGCEYELCLENEFAEIFNINWEVKNWDTTSYDFLSQDSCAKFAFYKAPPHDVIVQVSLSNSCGISEKTGTFQFDCDSKLSKLLLLYPNPAQDILNIRFENLSHHILHTQPANFQICDSFGRIMFSDKIGSNSASFDISNLHSGIYSAFVMIDSEILSARFIKSR